jgi:hypothetical protein
MRKKSFSIPYFKAIIGNVALVSSLNRLSYAIFWVKKQPNRLIAAIKDWART